MRYERQTHTPQLELGKKNTREIIIRKPSELEYKYRFEIKTNTGRIVFDSNRFEKEIDIDLHLGDPGVDELKRPDGVAIRVIKSPSGKKFSLLTCQYVYGICISDAEALSIYKAVNSWHEQKFGEGLPQLANSQTHVGTYKLVNS